MKNNSVQSYELKQKIAQVFDLDPEGSRRLSDYIGTTGFVIENPDIYIDMGRLSREEIDKIQQEYIKFAQKIIALKPEDVVALLQQNPPQEKGTEANVASIKEIFIH